MSGLTVDIATIRNVISEVFPDAHTIYLDVAGPCCGVEDMGGVVLHQWDDLDDLYQWIIVNREGV